MEDMTSGSRMYGASDDLVELDGECLGELGKYGTSEDEPVMVAFSDGTVANIWYGDEGIWKIRLLNKGLMYAGLEQCTDSEADPYSDVLTFLPGKLRAWSGGSEVQ